MLLLFDEYGQTQRRTIGFKPVEYVFENSDGPALQSGWVYKPDLDLVGADYGKILRKNQNDESNARICARRTSFRF